MGLFKPSEVIDLHGDVAIQRDFVNKRQAVGGGNVGEKRQFRVQVLHGNGYQLAACSDGRQRHRAYYCGGVPGHAAVG